MKYSYERHERKLKWAKIIRQKKLSIVRLNSMTKLKRKIYRFIWIKAKDLSSWAGKKIIADAIKRDKLKCEQLLSEGNKQCHNTQQKK